MEAEFVCTWWRACGGTRFGPALKISARIPLLHSRMKNAASYTIALSLAFAAALASPAKALEANSDPVGYYTLNLVGASDNVMSVPMTRDAVFAGVVDQTPVGQNTFNALAGAVSPAWAAGKFEYQNATQPQTYYVEFTSGALKGETYKINTNGTNSLTLDTEGDALNSSYALAGNPTGSLAAGDTFLIRPYFRVKDIFEQNGTPIIDARTVATTAKDDILVPDYTTVGINKAPSLTIYYLAGQGWRAVGQGSTDFSNYILRPNESVTVRRRNTASVAIPNLGGVLMNKNATFIPGGSATSGNDVYLSINRPQAVSLNASGLRTPDPATTVIVESPTDKNRKDELLAFDDKASLNKTPSATYYYLAGKGWRQVGSRSTTIGDTVMLQPGKAYILRKKAGSAGADWTNMPTY